MAVTPASSQDGAGAQNPAYRRASHFYPRRWQACCWCPARFRCSVTAHVGRDLRRIDDRAPEGQITTACHVHCLAATHMGVVVADLDAVVLAPALALAHAQFDGEAVLCARRIAHADAGAAALVAAVLLSGVLAGLRLYSFCGDIPARLYWELLR